MSKQEAEANLQHILLVVEAAQRAGHSEQEIAELVDAAIDADAEIERAA